MGDFCCPWRGQKDSVGTLQNETYMSCSRFLLSSSPVFPKPHDKHSPWVLNHGSRGPPHEALMNFRHEKAGVISEVNPTRATFITALFQNNRPRLENWDATSETRDWKAERDSGRGRKINMLLMQRRPIQTQADWSVFTLHSCSCTTGCLLCLQYSCHG